MDFRRLKEYFGENWRKVLILIHLMAYIDRINFIGKSREIIENSFLVERKLEDYYLFDVLLEDRFVLYNMIIKPLLSKANGIKNKILDQIEKREFINRIYKIGGLKIKEIVKIKEIDRKISKKNVIIPIDLYLKGIKQLRIGEFRGRNYDFVFYFLGDYYSIIPKSFVISSKFNIYYEINGKIYNKPLIWINEDLSLKIKDGG